MNKNLAPLVIFTYNRLDTLELVIQNLQKNTLARKTDLFIFSDYAKREKNYGLAKDIIEGVTDIINQYGKVKVLEDDKRIFSISGYTGDLPSLKTLDDEEYVSYRPYSWGWAIPWSYTVYKLDKYCFYPKVSKVQNVGFGEDVINTQGKLINEKY